VNRSLSITTIQPVAGSPRFMARILFPSNTYSLCGVRKKFKKHRPGKTLRGVCARVRTAAEEIVRGNSRESYYFRRPSRCSSTDARDVVAHNICIYEENNKIKNNNNYRGLEQRQQRSNESVYSYVRFGRLPN